MYLTKLTNSAIEIYLELDTLKNMSVKVAGLADTFCCRFFRIIWKVVQSGF